MPPNLSAEYLDALAQTDSSFRNMLRRELISTYSDFLEVLYDDLTLIIERLEENPQHFLDESEDATSQRLLDIAFGYGYLAEHLQKGGNVDFVIARPRMNFRWIGEAKRFGNVGDLRQGYLQLSTRYRPQMASDGVMHGGLIGYLRRPNAAACMAAWEAAFATLQEAPENVRTRCTRRGALAFISEHKHQDFGTPLRIWHTCIVLGAAPKDRSGQKAKKYIKS